MGLFRIALANIAYPRSPDDSIDRVLQAIDAAAAAKAGLVCFPECYVPGYRRDLSAAPHFDELFLVRAWRTIMAAAGQAGIAVILGTERPAEGVFRLTALVINADGTSAGFQDKLQLDPSEDLVYDRGQNRNVFRAGSLTFGVVICHEGWRYPESVRTAAQMGAQIVFHPHFGEAEPGSYRPTTFADPANTFHEKAVMCRAAENTVYFASVNCASEGSPTTSAIAGPDGSIIAWQPYGKEGLLIADLELEKATGYLAGRLRSHLRITRSAAKRK